MVRVAILFGVATYNSDFLGSKKVQEVANLHDCEMGTIQVVGAGSASKHWAFKGGKEGILLGRAPAKRWVALTISALSSERSTGISRGPTPFPRVSCDPGPSRQTI